MIEDLIIPKIYCPFPSAISPHAEAVNQHTLDWVSRFNLVTDTTAWRRLEKSKFGRLAARAYPNASLDRLEIVSDWNTWLFVLDDQCDEWGLGKNPERLTDLHQRCLEVLAGSTPNADDAALIYAIEDIKKRLAAIMPFTWMMRFTQSVSEYFESTEWEAENRLQNIWPDAETYIRMRPFTGGLLTDIDLIDLTEAISLPLEARKHPILGELIAITNNVVCWSNDIISLQKERSHRDMHNLVLIINHHEPIDLQAAIEKVKDMIEAEVRCFLRLETTLPRFGEKVDDDLAKFIAVMRAWMRGNLDWSFESGRYLFGDADSSQKIASSQQKESLEDVV